MSKRLLISCLALAAGLSGCQTAGNSNQLSPQDIAYANLWNSERIRHGISAGPYQPDRLEKLWADKPAYLKAWRQGRATQPPRLVSGVKPKYPWQLEGQGYKAGIDVSFFINKDGVVEEARVIETTDSRFDEAALESARKSQFSAARNAAGPVASFGMHRVIFGSRQ